MRTQSLLLSLLLVFFLVSSCARPKGATPELKRDYVLQMKDNTLAELYAKKPYMKDVVEKSAGYAVFSNFNTQLLVVGTGNGYGVAVDNSNGDKIFMRMAEGGVGLGVALTDFREVVIFNNKEAFLEFVTEGWNFGAKGDAAAKYKDDGAATGGEVPLDSDIIVVQMTKSGIALRASMGAAKYWIDDELNNPN